MNTNNKKKQTQMKKNLRLIVCAFSVLALMISCGRTDSNGEKSIRKTQRISIDSPEGTVPRLPYQIWVTYNDGTGEFRQVRWSNSALVTEKEQSDPQVYHAGKRYLQLFEGEP